MLYRHVLVYLALVVGPMFSADTPTVEPTPAPKSAAQTLPVQQHDIATAQDIPTKQDSEAFEKIADAAGKTNDLILLLIGGSLAILIGSSYLHPKQRLRWLYLLFPLGWALLARSVFYGLEVRGTYLAHLVNPSNATRQEWLEEVNRQLIIQRDYLQYGLAAFAVWLMCYVIWWIYKGGTDVPQENKNAQLWLGANIRRSMRNGRVWTNRV